MDAVSLVRALERGEPIHGIVTRTGVNRHSLTRLAHEYGFLVDPDTDAPFPADVLDSHPLPGEERR